MPNNRTKRDLEAALKRQLLKKPLDKITINELSEDAGVSRMTFYYHFKDIYDLVEWSCIEDARTALQGKKTYATWKEGLFQIFEAVYENRPFIINVYKNVERERIERFLSTLVSELIEGVVMEQSSDLNLQEEKRLFIARFYTYSYVGIMLDWIGAGMKADYNLLVDDIAVTMKGNIRNSALNFSDQ